MAILERVSTLLRANLNDLLDRAEDPEKMVRQLLADMQGQLVQVRTHVAVAMADEQKLKAVCRQNEAKAEGWQRKAEIAVVRGDDELAKQALGRVNGYAELMAGFLKQYEAQAAQVVELRDALQQLEAKMQSVQARKDLLIARSRRARAQAVINETLSAAGNVPALSAFARMEEKVEEQELRADAVRELDRDTLEVRFEQLEQEAGLEEQLQEMKARMALPAGSAAYCGNGKGERNEQG